jgi:hypothetical protein
MSNLFGTLYTMVLNLFSGKNSGENIYETIIELTFSRIIELINILAYGVSGLIFLLSGFLISYFNLLSQYDRIGTISIGAVAIGGLVLCFIGFGILYNTATKKISTNIKHNTENKTHHETYGSPIENAIAALVLDFVKEREEIRQSTKSELHEKSNDISDEILEQ